MKKKIQNTSLMFLLLIAVCFPTHNVYEQKMDSKRVNICPKTYNRKKW